MRFGTDYREDLTLSDGAHVRFRAVTPSDKQKLAEGFARLSAQSRYGRFVATKTALTADELQAFTNPDGVDHLAIGAVEIDKHGKEADGIGISRFLRIPGDHEVAEIALAVADARQGTGIGRMLLERLIPAAAERGIRRIRCHLLANHQRMRKLIKRVFGDAALSAEGDMMSGEFPIPPATEPEEVSRDPDLAPLFDLLRLIAEGTAMSIKFGFAWARQGMSLMTTYTRQRLNDMDGTPSK
jgi:GNAT superfamily N-acetyltransferase